MKLLCKLGIHKWKHISPDLLDERYSTRMCTRCLQTEQLVFFSNRTHEWVIVPSKDIKFKRNIPWKKNLKNGI